METSQTVKDLGLYISECCSAELIFDTGDLFLKCPHCSRSCAWDLEEEIVSYEEFERLHSAAA
jgi:hypothetical protein